MKNIDWEKCADEIGELMAARDEVLDKLDYLTGNMSADQCNMDRISLLRFALVTNFSKTKAMYKTYGLDTTVHAVYDYLMARTVYNWREKRAR